MYTKGEIANILQWQHTKPPKNGKQSRRCPQSYTNMNSDGPTRIAEAVTTRNGGVLSPDHLRTIFCTTNKATSPQQDQGRTRVRQKII